MPKLAKRYQQSQRSPTATPDLPSIRHQRQRQRENNQRLADLGLLQDVEDFAKEFGKKIKIRSGPQESRKLQREHHAKAFACRRFHRSRTPALLCEHPSQRKSLDCFFHSWLLHHRLKGGVSCCDRQSKLLACSAPRCSQQSPFSIARGESMRLVACPLKVDHAFALSLFSDIF